MYSRVKLTCFGAALLCALGIGSQASADEAESEGIIKQRLGEILPDIDVDSVAPSPLEGLYEVVIGQRLVYVTGDGKFLIQGNLIDLEQQKNLTEPRISAIKAAVVQGLDEEQMVIFGPKDAKHSVTVFTDIDCGYCRKLHSEMASYSEKGIRIRYLFFPRAGVNSGSYTKAVSVWCADDRQEAMTLAKQGKAIEQRDCPNPVKHDLELGAEMGVTGTPSIVLDNGTMVPGYVPADRLLAVLENASQSTP